MPRYLFFLTFILAASAADVVYARILESAHSADKLWTLTLSVQPDAPRLSDTITFTLDVSPAPVKAEFPVFGEKIGELKITDIQTTDTQLVITAVPIKAGVTPLWGIPVKIGGETITVPQCSLDIQSAVSEDEASLDSIAADTKPFDVRNPYLPWFIAAAVLVFIAALLFLLRKRKTETEVAAVPLTLQELALQKLTNLLDSRKHEADVRQFFVELSDIVRWYIEQKTGLRSPELTTEEFLRRTSSNRYLPDTDKMSAFLLSADFVKFAKHQPAEEEIMLAFRRAVDLTSNG
ncbi:MAG: LPXTG cell wall anchor domain-containing protein [Planctomycetaceae bacterium]|jgi:hypothetical protein|nr:LPXTG cell wall anchor domain-containing protein [Planctomycetaceae bacterium]